MVLETLKTHYLTNVNTNEFFDLENGAYNFYYSDGFESKILSKNLTKVDIKSAFPTICNLLFDKNSDFIQQLNSIEDKLERNIFISNSLKVLTDQNYLKLLNQYCKIIVFSYIYNNYENVEIFEYQKDGVLFNGTKTYPIDSKLNNLIKNNFEFHISQTDLYLRFQSTSIYYTNEIDIKGNYKNPPEYIISEVLPIIFENPYDNNISNIQSIYNKKYFSFLRELKMTEEINKYFKFNNKYYLDINGKKTLSITDTNPTSILTYFIYPILELLRVN